MKILVSGGTGFVGRHVVTALVEEGHNVDVISRQVPSFDDGADSYSIHHPTNLEGYDVIYLLAGVLGSRKTPHVAYERAHVGIPKSIVPNLSPTQKLVYMSTAYVAAVPPSNHTGYVHTKLAGEAIARQHPNTTIVRPGFIYGPRDMHHYPLFKWISKLGKWFPIPGKGTNRVCPTYVQDVAWALLPQNLIPGEYRIAGDPLTINSLVYHIAKTLEVEQPRFHIPAIIKGDFFGKERVFQSDLEPTTPFTVGLGETVEWYITHEML